jgi:hypothetical protein
MMTSRSRYAAWVWLFEVSIRVAGRVVPVMHLIASRRLQAGPLTTTMLHRRGQNHHDAPSSWLRRRGTGPRLVTGDAGDAGEACTCRPAARRAGYQPPGSAE